MASTRNKNTITNYNMELKQNSNNMQYNLYKNSQSGEAFTTDLAGLGLIQGRMPANKLSYNPTQIESFLFGINSTNLVNPEAPLTPELKQNSSVNMYEKSPVIMPDPLVIQRNRPFPVP